MIDDILDTLRLVTTQYCLDYATQTDYILYKSSE